MISKKLRKTRSELKGSLKKMAEINLRQAEKSASKIEGVCIRALAPRKMSSEFTKFLLCLSQLIKTLFDLHTDYGFYILYCIKII